MPAAVETFTLFALPPSVDMLWRSCVDSCGIWVKRWFYLLFWPKSRCS